MIINSKNEEIDKKLLTKQFVNATNAAYDRGGADVLKVILDVADNLDKELKEDISEYTKFLRHVIEMVRQSLQKTVTESVSETKTETNLIHSV